MKRFFGYSALLLLLMIGALWGNWQLVTPSHKRDWRVDYDRLPHVEEQDQGFVVSNIRNWDYTDEGAVARDDWITAPIDPAKLTQMYFLVEPFGPIDAIAHTMLAFTFNDGSSYIASVEARREKGEVYSPAKAAILPIYEYLVVWATERDMFGNTEYSAGDELYLYPLDIPLLQQQAVLIAMLQHTMQVEDKARWYNTLFSNCTNVLAGVINDLSPGAIPINPAWVLTGYADEFLYKHGFIANDMPFAQVEQRAFVSPLIRENYAIKDPAQFSAAIRTNMLP